MANCCQCLTQGLPVSLLSMLLALSGAGVLAAGVILNSHMNKAEDRPLFHNRTKEEDTALEGYVALIDTTVLVVSTVSLIVTIMQSVVW